MVNSRYSARTRDGVAAVLNTFKEGITLEHTIDGVTFDLGNDGVVIWSDSWAAIFNWARARQHGFSARPCGPDTYGHVEVRYTRL